MEYKHYSFDLWGTLIKPNPKFSPLRANYIHSHILKHYGKPVAVSYVEEVVKKVGEYADGLNAITGRCLEPLEMYAQVLFRCTGSLKNITMLNMELLYKEIEKIFLENPPLLYSEETKSTLVELKLRGKTMSTMSNTGFARGDTMVQALKILDIARLFEFQLYSDREHSSKPDPRIFDALRIGTDHYGYKNLEVLHVGNDDICDARGAIEAGFPAFIINSNGNRIKDLL